MFNGFSFGDQGQHDNLYVDRINSCKGVWLVDDFAVRACLVAGIADTSNFYLIQAAPLLHLFETPRRHHIRHRQKFRHARQQGFAAIINLRSPGHNHFWILDDVINNAFWCRLRGNSFTTLIWAFPDLSLSYTPWNLAHVKAKSDLIQEANRWSIASVVIGERNSMEKSSKGAFCEESPLLS